MEKERLAAKAAWAKAVQSKVRRDVKEATAHVPQSRVYSTTVTEGTYDGRA